MVSSAGARGQSIALDAAGNSYLTGPFYDVSLAFNSITLTNAGGEDIFVGKIGNSTTVGVTEKLTFGDIHVYPNPFTEKTTITFGEEQNHTTIKIVDILGQCIQQLTTNNQQLTIDMTGYAKGIYFITITDEKKNVVNKKIIKN